MALTGLADYREALGEAPQLLSVNIATRPVIAGRTHDLWTAGQPAGVAPTTAVVPTNATIGSLGQINSASTLSIIGARFASLNPGQYIICDRLSHQGGLVGNSASAQTTNLPTAALTRYTSGAGVMMGLTIYTALGTTATTVMATYTNQAGGSSESPLVVIGSTTFNTLGRMILVPLAEGDTGVRSVETVSLTATTGTAGNFGVTLFKPLYVVTLDSTAGVVSGGFISGNAFGGIPTIEDDACLFAIAISGGIDAQGSGALLTVER